MARNVRAVFLPRSLDPFSEGGMPLLFASMTGEGVLDEQFCRLRRCEALAYLLHLSRQQIVNQRLIGDPPLLCDRL